MKTRRALGSGAAAFLDWQESSCGLTMCRLRNYRGVGWYLPGFQSSRICHVMAQATKMYLQMPGAWTWSQWILHDLTPENLLKERRTCGVVETFPLPA